MFQEVIRLTYSAAYVFAAGAFAYSGFWRRFPICFLLLIIGSILAVTHHPESSVWINQVYLPLEPFAVVLRLAAVLECLYYQAALIPKRHLLMFGLCMAALSITSAVAMIDLDGALENFVQLRRYVQIGTAIVAIGAAVFLWAQRLWKWDVNAAHAIILLILTIKHATYSVLSIRGVWTTATQWQAANWPSLAITSLCCLAWGILALWCARASVQSDESDPRSD
jgi:hypothetical protein